MKSHSQAGQDLFVDLMLESKNGGHYVDIGCESSSFHNNTHALEADRDYTGLLVDISSGCENRKGQFVKSDAVNPNDALKIAYSQLPVVSDYLSLDCDDATLGAFSALPWDRVTWRVMTIETDVYRKGPSDRDKMRAMLKAMGYLLVCGNVIVEWPMGTFVPYEDWFAHPDLVNSGLPKRFCCDGQYWRDIISR